MPFIEHSSYKAPSFFKNAHIQTVYPSLFRRVRGIAYFRERINTLDGDFIDLDWSRVNSQKLVVISHGLEASSASVYVKGMIKIFNRAGWDGVALNFRGCSGEPNRLLRSYHSGATEDLEMVLLHILKEKLYKSISLVGFSLGGNVILKYLGERGSEISSIIRNAATISVPCDLKSSAVKLAQKENRIYMKRFLLSLNKKMKAKIHLMPSQINYEDFKKVRTFKEFDDFYTGPVHGFLNAEDYWAQCSSKRFVSKITIPTLLISALDDPFLGQECYPVEEANKSKYFSLELPENGGHVGFVSFNGVEEYWHETRVVSFITNGF